MNALVATLAHRKLTEDLNRDSQVKLIDGKHEAIVSLKLVRSFSRKVWRDFLRGDIIKEIKISSVNDRTFDILIQLFLKSEVSVNDYNDEMIQELYQIGLELEIEDFIIWYSSTINVKNISFDKIIEYLTFIQRTHEDQIILPKSLSINLNELLENIINFIGTNVINIEINELIDFCRVGVCQLRDNQDFIDRIISQCEQLGHFQNEKYVDHLYIFLLELINDSSIFGYLIEKMDVEKIKPSAMSSIIDLVKNDEYKEYHTIILEMNKKFININERNPLEIKTQNAQLMSFVSITCEILQSNQTREISIQKFLDIFQIQNNFDDIYNFFSQKAEMNDSYTIKVACTIGLSETIDDQQNTILLSACLKNNYILVESLINNRCNKAAINSMKDNAILCTSISGCIKIFDFLVTNGLDANYVNENSGKNALLIACENGNFELIKHLVSLGFSTLYTDRENENCVFLAVSSGNLEIIKYLITNDAVPTQQSSNNDLPILRSVMLGHLDIFTILLQYPRNQNVDENFLTIAISNQRFNIIKYILDIKLTKIQEKHIELAKSCLSNCNSPEEIEVRKMIDPNISYNDPANESISNEKNHSNFIPADTNKNELSSSTEYYSYSDYSYSDE
ncbi:hypothetical protein TVAG_264240 [Trichomonas vaginalis G3]|uniref:Uncharacterized protein n=1 Tax=Trichomonas vaginalis (strain ATCC PRA-98 / G3) TaxID=412133 RepID=A2FFM1_TRIV3|nr:positive regulation of MDA-5 signaling pathway [Trichomonas vaginalis G3]EAX96300.1 hypothetical protein TVAG_264240 [Trichomonas vaginalis G3]KAI5491265.1 positive regulation of MDA-5 signaling pathway [Trichomonas vaginalis G3]|eukprot:XP_001309230.1 hypothetical protein [Trichomonas vaginalis G3]